MVGSQTKVKTRITAHLEQFYGEVKNSRSYLYGSKFLTPLEITLSKPFSEFFGKTRITGY